MHGIVFEQGLPGRVSEDLLVYFVTHCATHLRLSHKTIKLYLCGVRHAYIEIGRGDPFLSHLGTPLLRLQQVLRGVKKATAAPARPRLPITWELLTAMGQVLQHGFFGDYWDALMLAALLLGFFAFLRCGEFTTPTETFDPSIHLARADIQAVYNQQVVSELSVFLKASKTDPFRKGVTVHLFRMLHESLCPVKAILAFLELRDAYATYPSSPLFLLPTGRPLTRQVFLNLLSRLCRHVGVDPTHYSGHSLRIGAATTAAQRGIPDHLVQVLGRWSSSCFKLYIKTSKETIHDAHVSMTGCIM